MAEHPSWAWLRAEVVHAIDRFVAALDGLDGATGVPGLDWTVAELTAHIASLPRLYRSQHRLGEGFERPADFARFSAEQRSHIDTGDLAVVADHLRSEVTGLLVELDALDAAGGDGRIGGVDAPRWQYGQPTTARNWAAAILSELVIHGQDLAGLTGNPPRLTRDQANAVLPAMFAVAPAFTDPEKARRAAGVYHMHFRGGADWIYRIGEAGDLTVERGRPDRPDARLDADPAVFVLVALGRRNPNLAALRGQMIAWGRRPWKMIAAGDITVAGV